MPKDKKLKTKARYENSKIDTFMFPQFKHISHLAKKIELPTSEKLGAARQEALYYKHRSVLTGVSHDSGKDAIMLQLCCNYVALMF